MSSCDRRLIPSRCRCNKASGLALHEPGTIGGVLPPRNRDRGIGGLGICEHSWGTTL